MTSNNSALEVKTKDGVRFGKELREREFLFDGTYVPLNHGSFGTYPRAVRSVFRSFQDEAEARPDPFIIYDYPRYLDSARESMSKLLNTPSSTLVFLPNATTGTNTVLRNLIFEEGDYILMFSTVYGALNNTIAYVCETTPVKSVKIEYTYPVEDDWLVGELEKTVKEIDAKGGKVRVAVFDTVVSMPGVRMPFERMTQKCRDLGVLSCVDGAHGVGHVDIDLGKLDPDFFVSNCHKWLHVPRGCAIFHIPHRNQHLIRSTVPTSHGFVPRGQTFKSPLPKPSFEQNDSEHSAFTKAVEKPEFVAKFEFVGTIDNSPYLCIPAALKWRESLGGEEVIRTYCQTLAGEAGKYVAEELGTEVLENGTGSLGRCCMSNVRLPIPVEKVYKVAAQSGIEKEDVGVMVRDWMKKLSHVEYGTFIVVFWYGNAWWTRLSAQVYLEMGDFEFMVSTLRAMCERVEKGEWAGGKGKL